MKNYQMLSTNVTSLCTKYIELKKKTANLTSKVKSTESKKNNKITTWKFDKKNQI